nr:phosphotransferase [Sciscionella sp. SE31]
MPLVARTLGRLHRAARDRGLRCVDANQPFPLGTGRTLAGFAEPRRGRLLVALSTVRSPLSVQLVDAWLERASVLPTALYKDANPRNVILSRSYGPVLIDFDTLTLAPVGYDLAKLVVTTSMTFGALSQEHILMALHAYTKGLGVEPEVCPLEHLQIWAEFHHLLTSPWLGEHYCFDWTEVRPWTADEVATAAHAPTPIRS